MDEALFHLRIRIRDPKFFVARLLQQLSQQTGFHPDVVAEVLVAFTALALIAWRHAHFLANSILIFYPLLVTYVFVEERPSRDDLLIYWAAFSILTLLDRVLESIFAYYVLKVALLAMLFMEPFRFVDKVKGMLHQTISNHLDNWGKSPRPAKPEEDEAAHALAVQMKGAIEKEVNQTDSIMALRMTDSQHSNVQNRFGGSSIAVTAPSSTTRTDKFWMAPATKMRASEIRLNGSDLLTARSMSPNTSSMRMGSTQDVNSERQQIAQLPSAVTCKEAVIETKTPPKQVVKEETKSEPAPPPPPPSQPTEEIPTKTPPLLSPRTADMTAIEKIETSTPPNAATPSKSEVSQGEKTMPGISLRTEKSDSQASLQEEKETKSAPAPSAPEVIKTAVSPSPVAVTPPVAPASAARTSRSDSSVKSEYVSLTPVQTAREPVTPVRTARDSDSSPQRMAERTTSVTDIPSKKRFRGSNPMSVDSSYRLSSSRSEDNIHREIGPPPNLNDLIFYPTNKIVFNAPFDFDNITYHMQMWNKSRHNIAFAVKGNCVPRVTAYPPCGIIESGHKIFVAVTVKKFEFNDADFNKDRIVFEYVLLKDSQKNEKAFSHRLLQDAEVRRRKNIYISYNP